MLHYNKRDLAKEGIPLLAVEKMDQDLNRQLKAPAFPASAITGSNVIETLKKAINLTVASVKQRLD